MRNIKYIAIHCAATRPSSDIGAKEIDRWHKQRGWSGVGYHYVIRRDGTVEPGRPVEKIGAHVANYNANSIGICLVGGISESGKSENNFEPKQWASLKALVAELKARFPGAIIQGHRDFPRVAKDCPCFDAKKWAKDEGLAA